MKKLLLLLLVVFTANTLFAQDTSANGNAAAAIAKKTKEKVAQTGSRDRLVLDFTYDNWIRNVNGLSTKKMGFGFNLYFFYDVLLGKSRFSFAPGLGIGLSDVNTNQQLIKPGDSTTIDNYTANYDKTKTNFVPFQADQNIKRYMLNTLYVDIPIEFRYRSKPNKRNKSVKVAVGFKGGVLVENHTRVTQTGPDGNREVIKTRHYSDLSTFRYGPTLRIGYGPFSIIGYYGLGELFTSNGPQSIHPISVGISINGL